MLKYTQFVDLFNGLKHDTYKVFSPVQFLTHTKIVLLKDGVISRDERHLFCDLLYAAVHCNVSSQVNSSVSAALEAALRERCSSINILTVQTIQKDDNRSVGGDLVNVTLNPQCPAGVLAQKSHLFLYLSPL